MKAIVIWIIWFAVSVTISTTIIENTNFSNGLNAIIGLVIFVGLAIVTIFLVKNN